MTFQICLLLVHKEDKSFTQVSHFGFFIFEHLNKIRHLGRLLLLLILFLFIFWWFFWLFCVIIFIICLVNAWDIPKLSALVDSSFDTLYLWEALVRLVVSFVIVAFDVFGEIFGLNILAFIKAHRIVIHEFRLSEVLTVTVSLKMLLPVDNLLYNHYTRVVQIITSWNHSHWWQPVAKATSAYLCIKLFKQVHFYKALLENFRIFGKTD